MTTTSPERLAELQAMPYEEYLKTPEWKETRKRILKRDNHVCQGCHATSVFTIHHYTHEHQGHEDDNDLVTLCGPCQEQLLRKMAQLPTIPFLHRIGVGVGVATVGTIGIEGFLQAPLPAEIGVLIGAFLVAKNSPALYAKLKEMLPPEVMAWLGSAPKEGKRSTLDIWLGRQPKKIVDANPNEQHSDQRTDTPAPVIEGPIFPEYRADETLRLGQAIDRKALTTLTKAAQLNKRVEVAGRRFEPHINALLGKGMILAAVQGSGKSMLSGLVIEQAGECDAPAIVLDHKGEYAPIAELPQLSGLIAGGAYAQKMAEKRGLSYFALTTKNADAFVKMVISEHLQAVVILPSYGDTWLGKAEIVAEVGQALMRHSARMRQEDQKVLPCLVLLDEAQLYIPQNVSLLPPEAQKNKEVLDNLSNAFFALVSNGRSNGYTMCFATQSLTYIAKWAIKSSQIRVIMRHVEHNDLKMCEEIIGPKETATREELETMPSGVGIVFGFTPKPMVVQFDTRQSRDESETPTIERLRQARQNKSTPTAKSTAKVGDLNLDELMALLSQGKTEKAPETETLADYSNDPLTLGQEVSISREVFDIAVRMRKNKTSTGYRDLMTSFALSEHFAKILNKMIDDAIQNEAK